MAKRSWSADAAKKRIAARMAEVKTVTIKEYVRTTDLQGIGNGVAYRVHGVHLYVDILNMATCSMSRTLRAQRAIAVPSDS